MNVHRPYCWAPWVNLQHGNVLEGNTPCCEWNGDGHKGSIKDYINSKHLRKIKKNMINPIGKLRKSCEVCRENEKIGNKSRRMYLHEDEDVKVITDSWKDKDILQPDVNHIVYLDYRPSNLCNLKCRMCGASSSSMIGKEQGIEPEIKVPAKDYKNLNMSTLKKVAVVGGEPSIQQDLYDFLDYCCELGLNNTLELSFTTNATNTNKKWMDRLSKWKYISVQISLDGIGSTMEYIRNGASWPAIEKNCTVYEEILGKDKIEYSIVATAYNIPNVEDWAPWFLDKNNVSIWPVEGKHWQSVDAIPTNILKEKLKYLKNYKDVTWVLNLINMINMAHYNHKLNEQLKNETFDLQNIRGGHIYDVNKIYKDFI
tara:strand:+ start:6608 stop:7717 length:1110 start_codon:yes stop_codon:yes gene_type:complete